MLFVDFRSYFYNIADAEIIRQKLKHCNENTHDLLVDSKWFGLEVNAEETAVYVHISSAEYRSKLQHEDLY